MKLKTKPQDFIVDEINTLRFGEGKYAYYKLRKVNLETQTALQRIANAFKINKKYINLAGTKDKVAITTQFVSISMGPKKNIEEEDLQLEYVGNGSERLNLGMLEGNTFEITIRDISSDEMQRFKDNVARGDDLCIPNYYDNQRFGINKNNHDIGRMIVKRQFKEAAQILAQVPHFPQKLVAAWLAKHPTDYVGSLRAMPKSTLLMFVHAYQSYLWNESVKALVAKEDYHVGKYNLGDLFFPVTKIIDRKIPIISCDTETEHKDVEAILQKIMDTEKITQRDFIIRQMPELTASGARRSLLLALSDFSFDVLDDTTVRVVFSLGKGSYATMAIKALFS